jgi:guanine nucleotide-binding protein subunit beta-2-like 1 protein
MSSIEIDYVGSLYGHNGIVTSIVVGKNQDGSPLVISGSRDKKIIIWNVNLQNPEEITGNSENKTDEKLVGKPLKSLAGHSHFVSSLAISKDSKHLVSGSWDKTCRLWDLETYKTRQLLSGHKKDVLAVSFSSDNRLIISGSMDQSVKFWSIKGEEKHKIDDFNGWVSCINHIKRAEKQNLIAVGSWDQSVKLYDAKELTYLNSVEGFDYGVVSICSDQDGEFLFSGEKNGKIRVHKLNGDTSSELKSTIDVNADLHAISFESKYYMFIACATSKGLYINEVNKLNNSFYRKEVAACHSLAWDESSNYLFAGFADGVIRVFKFKAEN